jgi:hypothetical protein
MTFGVLGCRVMFFNVLLFYCLCELCDKVVGCVRRGYMVSGFKSCVCAIHWSGWFVGFASGNEIYEYVVLLLNFVCVCGFKARNMR